MVSLLLQFKLLMWKNCIIRKRRICATIFEILLPILMFLLWSSTHKFTQTSDDGTGEKLKNERYYSIENVGQTPLSVYYAPNNVNVQEIMKMVKEKYCSGCDLNACEEEEELVDKYKSSTNTDNMVGVYFYNVKTNKLPDQLTYSIRIGSSWQFMTRLYSTDPPFQAEEFKFYKTGFSSLQGSVDSAFIELKKNEIQSSRTNHFEIKNQQFPDPTYTPTKPVDQSLVVLGFGMIYMVIFILLLKGIMEEKCSGIKEIMKVMGFNTSMLFCGWYIHCMSLVVCTLTIGTILLKASSAVLAHGNATVVWMFFFLYCTSGVCFFVFISTLFSTSTIAIIVGPFVWIITLLAVNELVGARIPVVISYIILIFPNICMHYGLTIICSFETKGIGIHWSNLFTASTELGLQNSLGKVMIMLTIDSLIFIILAWYIDSVCPGKYGVGKPWSFPFKKIFWCARFNQRKEPDHYDEQNKTRIVKAEIEAVPFDIVPSIIIKELYKTFNKKTVVNGLNFEIYNNQLTVLLGHNGAGKTTTMNIITGMIKPTRGDVLLNKYSIKTHMDKIREFIGLCPQHNFSFPSLTVIEHLMFFAMLRKMKKSKARTEALNYLAMLSMSAKAKNVAKTLSGGMIRRLCLGMAMIGGTKVLLLDEPTSGLDPEARREIWDLLLKIRGERTILLTTQYMEEADVLGDRIAIMHSGELMCFGTSMFLKKIYGTGYIISVILLEGYNINTIRENIVKIVPGAKLKSLAVGSAKFELPTHDTQVLTRLFMDMEGKRESLRIGGYGVSITTMDDVFLKVGEIADKTDKNEKTQQLSSVSLHSLRENYNSGFTIFRQQFRTLLLKRFYFLWSSKIMLLCIIGGILFLHLNILIGSRIFNKKSGETELRLKMYSGSKTYYSYSKEFADFTNYYTEVVQSEGSESISTSSVSDNVLNIALNDMGEYQKLIIAAELNYSNNKMICNAMYGRYPIHALPISINIISNALLKYYTNDRSNKYSITVINKLFPTEDDHVDETKLMTGFSMPISMLGLCAFFGILLEYSWSERATGVKHLQIMSGVSRVLYWFCIFIVDFAIYCVIATVFILSAYFTDESIKSKNSICIIVCLYILYAFAIFPFSCLFHYKLTKEGAIGSTFIIAILFGAVLPMIIIIWEQFDIILQKPNAHIIQGLLYGLMLCPHFTFIYGLSKFYAKTNEIYEWESISENRKKKLCATALGLKQFPCCEPESAECSALYSFYAGDNSVSLIFIYFGICIILYTALFLFVDYGLASKCSEKFTIRKKHEDKQVLDSDVVAEQARINTVMNNTEKNIYVTNILDMLLVSNLQKWFRRFHAVKGLSFGVKEFECFGLLGINGAGKTTTFKMLTGEINMTSGTAQIYGFTLSKHKSQCLKEIGYCPQFDAFNIKLSTRQMLTCFANLRGIPETEVKREVDEWLQRFNILQYENILCDKLSGGNKRKLSTAMALIGDPPLIMLDEASCGVDPVSRRNIWAILSVCRKSGQALVLTSHSMDECEALCDRLGIMVDGQLRCIGDVQYLKNKFGQGFTLTIKLRPTLFYQESGNVDFQTALKNLKSNIELKYDCSTKEAHTGMLTYHVKTKGVTIGGMFEYMEKLKKTMQIIEDFTVGDTTLEEIFLFFAKENLV